MTELGDSVNDAVTAYKRQGYAHVVNLGFDNHALYKDREAWLKDHSDGTADYIFVWGKYMFRDADLAFAFKMRWALPRGRGMGA